MTPKWCWLHNLSSILNRVQLFLTEANKASVPISSTIVNEFGEACKQAFIKHFIEEREFFRSFVYGENIEQKLL